MIIIITLVLFLFSNCNQAHGANIFAVIEEKKVETRKEYQLNFLQSRVTNNNLYNAIVRGFAINFSGNVHGVNVVANHQKYFLDHKTANLKILQLNSHYISYITSELIKRKMPTELAFLPFVESRYNNVALSHAGAVGMWQFIKSTAKIYGLKITPYYDGRRDFLASTEAALDYLQHLYNKFKSWPIAISAYNCGENCISRRIEKLRSKKLATTYENLYPLLPSETQGYFPQLIAVRNILLNYDFYDISLEFLDKVRSMSIYETIISDKFNLLEELSKKNPELKKFNCAILDNKLIPPKGFAYRIIIPANVVQKIMSENN